MHPQLLCGPLCPAALQPEGPTADLDQEARVVDVTKPTALQGPQVSVASWAQQVKTLHVHCEILQLLLQVGHILGGRGQGGGMSRH